MPIFRKIPIEVEAVQFTDETKDRVYAWATAIQMNVTHSWDENDKPILKVPTPEGEMICSLGDYLIKEPFPTDWRKLYPCKQSIFEQSYKIIELFKKEKIYESMTLKQNKMDTTNSKQELADKWGYQNKGYDGALFDCRAALLVDLDELLKENNKSLLVEIKAMTEHLGQEERNEYFNIKINQNEKANNNG